MHVCVSLFYIFRITVTVPAKIMKETIKIRTNAPFSENGFKTIILTYKEVENNEVLDKNEQRTKF